MAAVTIEKEAPSLELGDKGLKRDALGFLSSVVIGVASTAPAYSLAASLGFVVAAVGLAAPAVMWVSFIPMLLIAIVLYYLNPDRPGLRHHLLVGGKGVRAGDRLARRLGDRHRRRGRHGELGSDRRQLQLPALRGEPARSEHRLGDARRRDLDRVHDLDLLRRDRGLRPDAVAVARSRDRRARRLLRGGALQGVRGSSAATRCTRRSAG